MGQMKFTKPILSFFMRLKHPFLGRKVLKENCLSAWIFYLNDLMQDFIISFSLQFVILYLQTSIYFKEIVKVMQVQ